MWYYKNTWHSIGNSIYALTAYFTLDYPVLNCKTFFDITQHLHPPFPLMWFDHWLLTKHFPKGLRKSMLPIYPNLAWTHSLNCLFIASDSWINQSWTARNPKQKKLLLLLLLLSHFSRVRLCDPIDGSPPGSPVPGILQARTLEWVAISFSNAWKWKVKVKSLSRIRLLETPWTAAYTMGFSRQEYWSGVPLPSPN